MNLIYSVQLNTINSIITIVYTRLTTPFRYNYNSISPLLVKRILYRSFSAVKTTPHKTNKTLLSLVTHAWGKNISLTVIQPLVLSISLNRKVHIFF